MDLCDSKTNSRYQLKNITNTRVKKKRKMKTISKQKSRINISKFTTKVVHNKSSYNHIHKLIQCIIKDEKNPKKTRDREIERERERVCQDYLEQYFFLFSCKDEFRKQEDDCSFIRVSNWSRFNKRITTCNVYNKMKRSMNWEIACLC